MYKESTPQLLKIRHAFEVLLEPGCVAEQLGRRVFVRRIDAEAMITNNLVLPVATTAALGVARSILN